jgi:hypothetical protein
LVSLEEGIVACGCGLFTRILMTIYMLTITLLAICLPDYATRWFATFSMRSSYLPCTTVLDPL